MTEFRSVITRGQIGWRNWLGRDIRKPFTVRETFCTLICSLVTSLYLFVKAYQTILLSVVAVHSLSHVCLFVIPWTSACQASLSFTIARNLLKLMSIESMMPPNHLLLCTLFFCPQSFPASGSFPMSPSSHQVAKVLELQLQLLHQFFQWIFRVDFL